MPRLFAPAPKQGMVRHLTLLDAGKGSGQIQYIPHPGEHLSEAFFIPALDLRRGPAAVVNPVQRGTDGFPVYFAAVGAGGDAFFL